MLKKLKLKKQTKALSLKKKKLNSLRKRVKAIKLERLRTFIPKDEIGRVYTLATDSPFYIAKDFMLRTMRAEIVRRFIYVGVVRARTHQAFRPLLSGYYRGLSFLDIDLITYYYRRTSRFLLILLLKNQRLCFISEELTKYFDRKAFIFNYHMIFDH
ncbi:MAG TPA: hypothetical protein PKD85_00015 [Saprospiraceae bacterium]|nr:hypothetical protein [Saprospiraceae bacterium]